MSSNIFRSCKFYVGSAAGLAGFVYYQNNKNKTNDSNSLSLISNLSVTERLSGMDWRPPTRSQLINRLKGLDDKGHIKHSQQEPLFDLLIIGGGASGTGCALDAAARGLKVACVERGDFSCGTQKR
jgi:glycerol-3-phosphate dehydrogenase